MAWNAEPAPTRRLRVPQLGLARAEHAWVAGIVRFERCRLVFGASLPKHMRFASTNRPGCSAVVAHVLWEHEVVGSNPTTPTIRPGLPGAARG